NDGVAVAPLAGIIDFDRDPREPLDHEFAGLRRMPTGSASGNVDLLGGTEFLFADAHLVEKNVTGFLRDSAEGGIADGAGLLIDFFEHEVLEPALLRLDWIPGDVLHLPRNRTAIEIGQLHASWRDYSEVAVAQEEEIARVIKNRRHIGGNKVFVVAQTDHGRWAVASCNDFVRFIDRDHSQSENASQLANRFANRFLEGRPAVAGLQEVLLDQVGDDLGVGFGDKLVTFFDQLALECNVIFDDAVMHNHNAAGAIAMRVRIFFGWASVRGPARVPDAVRAIERFLPNNIFQIAKLALRPPDLQPLAV